MILNQAVQAEIEKVSEVASYLWQREWAERNGGNISVDLTDIFGPQPADLSRYPHCPLCMVGGAAAFPADSAGHIFYVKGTGERIRELRVPALAG